MGKTVFVVLVGSKAPGQTDEYQLLQEQVAIDEGRRVDLDVEVVFVPSFDQLRAIRRRLHDGSVDAIVTEPSSSATMELLLRDLRGKTGLVLLNAWSAGVEEAAASWGSERPFGTVSTDHNRIGQIQGQQISALVPQGGIALCVTGPPRSSAAQDRLAGVRASLRADIHLLETSGGQWTEADGAAAFNSWYGVFKARHDVVHVVACQSDELAVGAMTAAQAVASPAHREMFKRARFLGIDGCPNYGKRLVDEGKLAGSIVTPANTDMAIGSLAAFWREGRALPVRAFTEGMPYRSNVGPAAA